VIIISTSETITLHRHQL